MGLRNTRAEAMLRLDEMEYQLTYLANGQVTDMETITDTAGGLLLDVRKIREYVQEKGQ